TCLLPSAAPAISQQSVSSSAASACATPVRPLPFSTSTFVSARVREGFGGAACWRAISLRTGAVACATALRDSFSTWLFAARCTARLSGPATRTAPQTTSRTSSTAAIDDATKVARRHGRTSSCAGSGASKARRSSPVRRSVLREPLPRPPEALLERDPRPPAELLGGVRDVQHGAPRVPQARRLEARLRVDTGDLRAKPVQLENARLLAGADVEDAAGMADCREQRVDDVADEDEVAGLCAVAEDDGLVPAREALEEDRDDAALERAVLA